MCCGFYLMGVRYCQKEGNAMKKIWMTLDEKNWNAERKYQVCIWTLALLGAALGGLLWLALSHVALGTLDWCVVFLGMPVLLAPIAVFLYSCRHPFH